MSRISGRTWSGLAMAGAAALALSSAAMADTPATTPPVAAGPQQVNYPMESQRAGEEGTVVIQALVMPSGSVRTARIARSSGVDRLDNAALASVLGWHFKPGQENGETVTAWANVQVVYKVPTPGQ